MWADLMLATAPRTMPIVWRRFNALIAHFLAD